MTVRRAFVVAVSVTVLALVATPADALGHGHCAFRLRPTGERHGRVREARLVSLGCFRTLREARSVGTKSGNVLIGTEYDLASYLGNSTNYYAPNACVGDTWEVSYVTDPLNDMFQSGKGFGGCDHNKKFSGSNFLGDVLTCTPNCSAYGALGNEVSSLRWKP